MTTDVNRARVANLTRLALSGLEAMYDPGREILCTRTFEGAEQRIDHLALRYSVMSAPGIHRAREAGLTTSLDPHRLLESGLEQFNEEAIDHLGMALWANAVLGADLAGRIVPRLLRLLEQEALVRHAIGRIPAWALTGLTLQAERDGAGSLASPARRLRDLALEHCWSEAGGLFHHWAVGLTFPRSQALFSTQIYWIIALAEYGRVFDDAEALRVAGKAMDTLIARRDHLGGWAWRYDARTGRVTEHYPVYSVHQDGMAPMGLFALAAATGRDVRADNRASLGWLWRNQLGSSLVDEERQVIHRALRRRFPYNRAFIQLGRAASALHLPNPAAVRPWFLRRNATCRPYHLGWVLHAWSGRLDQVEGGP